MVTLFNVFMYVLSYNTQSMCVFLTCTSFTNTLTTIDTYISMEMYLYPYFSHVVGVLDPAIYSLIEVPSRRNPRNLSKSYLLLFISHIPLLSHYHSQRLLENKYWSVVYISTLVFVVKLLIICRSLKWLRRDDVPPLHSIILSLSLIHSLTLPSTATVFCTLSTSINVEYFSYLDNNNNNYRTTASK